MKHVESGHHGIKWIVCDCGVVVGAVKGGSKLSIADIMQDEDLHRMYHDKLKADKS